MNKQELEKIKQKALEEHIPIIMDDTLEVVDKILKEVKPKRILEIGTAVGYSAMCFSEYLQEGGKIDTIERDEERIAEAKINIKNVGVEDKINIYEGDAVEILPTLNEKYDVAFIDAAKGKYPFFLKEALRMIKPTGVILADNILYKGYVMSDYNKHKQRTAVRNLREYIKEVTEAPNLETEILEVVDGKKVTVYDEVEKTIKKDMPSRLHARRQMLKVLYPVKEVPTEGAKRKKNTKQVDLCDKLFTEIAPKYADRNGGYTRIIKIGQRKGDGALEVVLELV